MIKNLVIEKIKSVLDEATPYIAGHGGEIIFVDYEESTGKVFVSLRGTCEHCSLSSITLKLGLEEALKKQLPQVKEVVAV